MEAVMEFLGSLGAAGIKLAREHDQLHCYAPQGALTEEIRQKIASLRPQIMALLPDGKVHALQQVRSYPLSVGQKGLYVLHQLDPEASAYNVPLCFTSRRGIDREHLAHAWELLQKRYPILQARLVEEDGVALLRRDGEALNELLTHPVPARDPAGLLAFLRERAQLPFDLRHGPLARAELFTQPDGAATLLITIHHIVVDGVSSVILLKQLFGDYLALCAGATPQVAHAKDGWSDFVAWEDALLASPEGQAHAAYWQGQLEGAPPALDFPPVAGAAGGPDAGSAKQVLALDASLSQRIRDFSRSQGTPLSAIFLAAYQLLLHRYSGQDDIVVTMPVMGRAGGRFHDEVGYFVNMVPLRSRYRGVQAFSGWLQDSQRIMMDALYHSAYPLPLIVNHLKLTGANAHNVFGISYAYQNVLQLQAATMPGGQGFDVEMVDAISQEGASDLGLEIFEDRELFSLHLKFKEGLFSAQMAARMLAHMRLLLESAIADPACQVQQYPLLTAAELQRLAAFNNTAAVYDESVCIHELFARQAARAPHRPALAYQDTELSYGELHARCSTLAAWLQARGTGADSLVGLYMERSPELMVGLMGTLMAGGAYVPLDPDYPADRLGYMLEDTRCAVVLTLGRLKERLRALAGPDTLVVALDEEWDTIAAQAAGQVPLRLARPDSLAYVIYTSGSTGRPKGVMLEHRALMNRINWMQKEYRLDQRDVVLQKTPYSFDVSVWEFVWPMMAGAKVVFAEPGGHMDVHYLQRLIDSAGVTTLHYVPSMLRAFLENAQGACPSVRQIFCSGEALDWRSASQYRERFPEAELHNLYGPTEAAIDVTYYHCASLPGLFVPIGAPIDNTRIHILDAQGALQPIGVPGELVIAGHGLARGYLNREALTAERFVANPFAPGERMYRTGDLARWLDDGSIQYLGRMDTQVKVRGFRIELGEIETCLCAHPQVEDSIVIAGGSDADKRLLAFYVPRDGVQAEAEVLRTHLQASLPAYMVPSAFVPVERIPLTPSGKADRRALERMEVKVQSAHGYVAPATASEQRLAALWEQVLGLAAGKAGRQDNFFELGGHSLLATQLLSRLRGELGVELPLKAFFEHPVLADMALAVEQAQGAGETCPIVQVERGGELPLSYAQERLWFLDQLEPGSAGYNCPGAVLLRGELDIGQLQAAFQRIIARHETLRTVFPSEAGQARQRIAPQADWALEHIDLSGQAQAAELARQLCHAEALAPFDLATGPLLRGKVITLAAGEHILMLNMHHIVSDGWSLGVLVRELGAILAAARSGSEAVLPSLPVQYLDYSVWQRKRLEEEGVLAQQLAYWKDKLAGVPERLDLATDFARPGVATYAGATHRFALDAALGAQLRQLAERQGGTLFMALLGAWSTLLYRYSGQSDLCIGSPIANRQYAQTQDLIGMFVNTLALRARVNGQESFEALLAQLRGTCLEAYEHQDAPFEKVVEAVNPRREVGISPIFQSMLVLQNTDAIAMGPGVEPYPLETGLSKFDVSLEVQEGPQGLACAIEYSTALFKPQTIARMARHFEALCRAIVAQPAARIDALELLDAAELQRLAAFNNTAAVYDESVCIHELFARQAARAPHRPALAYQDTELSYGELHARCSALAAWLQARGTGADSLVGLYMERSPELMVGLMGTLMAGGAYVPLDPDYPADRLGYMLEDTRCAVVLTLGRLKERLRALAGPDTLVVALDEEWDAIAAQAAGQAPSRLARPDSLAYVIYTSGSTGRPKGVMIEHRSLVNHNQCVRRRYGVTEDDVQIQIASTSFDLFAEEVFAILASGAKLLLEKKESYLAPADLMALIARKGVTILNVPTAFFHQLMASDMPPGQVKTVVVGGEALDYARAAAFVRQFPQVKLINTYGPTETTIISSMTEVTPALLERHAFVPIGAPIDNTQIHILDARGALQPVGVAGELVIAGHGLARGYLHREDLTAERFVANPLVPGQRMYRSGDLARWLDDGTLQYLGRMDTQVKLRGFRIEPGEIEAQLNALPQIESSVVVAHGAGDARQLAAFFVARDGATVDTEALRAQLQAVLPAYMVPAAYLALDRLPMTPNGKVDRRSLESVEMVRAPMAGRVAPRNASERRLAGVWQEVLGVASDALGVHDSFFALGGHSLLAVRLMAAVGREFGQLLPLEAIFQYGDIAAMAAALERQAPQQAMSLVTIQAQGTAPALFAVPGVGGNVLSFAPLSHAIDRLLAERGAGPQPFHGLQQGGTSGSVEELAAGHLAAMRSIQPQGPYRLLGHSFGGLVAYEMAQQLLAQGEQVALLLLLDTLAPELMAQGGDDETAVMDAARAEANAACIPAAQVEAYLQLAQSQLAAIRSYQPKALPAPIPAALLRVRGLEGKPQTTPEDYGWGTLLGAAAPVRFADGGHMTMLHNDHALPLALQLLELNEAPAVERQ